MVLPLLRPILKHLCVYECKKFIFIIGYDELRNDYRILEITRPSTSYDGTVTVVQGPLRYSSTQLRVLLDELHKKHPECSLVCHNAACIWGFISLLESSYLVLVTQKKKICSLNGHYIYTIEKTQMIPITYKPKTIREESKYRKILSSLDLTKNFYFSYTYDITNTYQRNSIRGQKIKNSSNTKLQILCHSMFVWNSFAMKPLIDLHQRYPYEQINDWILPIIYGYIQQSSRRITGGDWLHILLISRRSRYFAGTRYLRRGVNSDGHVANEVETETIITRERASSAQLYRTSSMTQCRGSIPLYWSHTNLLSPFPNVRIEDPDTTHAATKRHFQRLFARYGRHVCILSLLRQTETKPREMLLGSAFGDISNISEYDSDEDNLDNPLLYHTKSDNIENNNHYNNDSNSNSNKVSMPIEYMTYDFLNNIHKNSSTSTSTSTVSVFNALEQISEVLLPLLGYFVEDDILTTSDHSSNKYYSNTSGVKCGLLQYGVLRTNCVDCLDRTNVAQFCYSSVALVSQLKALGIQLTSTSILELQHVLMEMWAAHGDAIAMQYGGSGAMHKMDNNATAMGTSNVENEFILTGGAKNVLVAAQRYYSNVLVDFERQQAIDVLLGIFEPRVGSRHVWELQNVPKDVRIGIHEKKQIQSSDMSSSDPVTVTVTATSTPTTTVIADDAIDEDALQESLHELAVIRRQLKEENITLSLCGKGFSSRFFEEEQRRVTLITNFKEMLLLSNETADSAKLDELEDNDKTNNATTTANVKTINRSPDHSGFDDIEVQLPVLFTVREDPDDMATKVLYDKYLNHFIWADGSYRDNQTTFQNIPSSSSSSSSSLSFSSMHNKEIMNMNMNSSDMTTAPLMGLKDNSRRARNIITPLTTTTGGSGGRNIRTNSIDNKSNKAQASTELTAFPSVEDEDDKSTSSAAGSGGGSGGVPTSLPSQPQSKFTVAKVSEAVAAGQGAKVGALLTEGVKLSATIAAKNISSASVFKKSFWGWKVCALLYLV
eukprot:gene5167-10329_t